MKSNKDKAAMTLGVVSLGFLASYPFSNSFFGGLVASGCEAAMIGGLADWFAVTALFKKPLGIPFRTAIIPRNRERIFKALAEMVENELLASGNVRKALEEYDISKVLLHFMNHHGGRGMVIEIAYHFIREIITRIDPDEVGDLVQNFAVEKLKTVQLAPLAADGLEWLADKGYIDKIFDFLLEQLIALVKHKEISALLTDLFLEALEAYERGLSRRIFFNQIMNFSPGQIAELVQEQVGAELAKAKEPDHPLRAKAKDEVFRWIVKLKYDGELQSEIEAWKMRQVNRMNITQAAAHYVGALQEELLADTSLAGKLRTVIERQTDKLLSDFASNAGERAKVDKLAKKVMSEWLDAYHGKIGDMVRGSLSRFSDAMLADFIESRAGNDLQMIRINGSVIGGLAGMAIYLLTFWLF